MVTKINFSDLKTPLLNLRDRNLTGLRSDRDNVLKGIETWSQGPGSSCQFN